MKKIISILAAGLLIAALSVPAFAVETETVTETITETATETVTEPTEPTETTVQATEATTEGETTLPAETNVETTTPVTEDSGAIGEITETTEPETTEPETLSLDQAVEEQSTKDKLIGIIDKVSGDDLAKITDAIEYVLLQSETLEYSGMDWLYKIVRDNINGFAYVIFGIGFISNVVVLIIKTSKEKKYTKAVYDSANAVIDITKGDRETIENFTAEIERIRADLMNGQAMTDAQIEKIEELQTELAEKDAVATDAAKRATAANILFADVLKTLLMRSEMPQATKDELYTEFEAKRSLIENGGEGHDGEK